MAMNERFENSLLAYARGELAPEEAGWMKAYLAENPEAREEAELLKSAFEALSLEAARVEREPDEGLEALRAKFILHHAARNRVEKPASGMSAPGGWWSRTKQGWQRMREQVSLVRGATLNVQFSSSATEAEIRALLQKSQGRIVNGPDAEATYAVKVPRKQRETLLHELRESPIVHSAEPRSSRLKK